MAASLFKKSPTRRKKSSTRFARLSLGVRFGVRFAFVDSKALRQVFSVHPEIGKGDVVPSLIASRPRHTKTEKAEIKIFLTVGEVWQRGTVVHRAGKTPRRRPKDQLEFLSSRVAGECVQCRFFRFSCGRVAPSTPAADCKRTLLRTPSTAGRQLCSEIRFLVTLPFPGIPRSPRFFVARHENFPRPLSSAQRTLPRARAPLPHFQLFCA